MQVSSPAELGGGGGSTLERRCSMGGYHSVTLPFTPDAERMVRDFAANTVQAVELKISATKVRSEHGVLSTMVYDATTCRIRWRVARQATQRCLRCRPLSTPLSRASICSAPPARACSCTAALIARRLRSEWFTRREKAVWRTQWRRWAWWLRQRRFLM